jgi:plastocyanin
MSVRRRLLVALTVLAGTPLLGATPAGAGSPTVDVLMLDNRFDPPVAVVAQDEQVAFTNFGEVAHDAIDDTGLDLFSTGTVSPPDTVAVGPLPGAGGYAYSCTFHPGMAGRLDVPVRVSRLQSPAGTQVTVRWAAHRAPTGLVFDVQRRRPGADRFVDWRSGVSAAATNWRPAVRGLWAIRARVREPVGDGASDWSPVRLIRVT